MEAPVSLIEAARGRRPADLVLKGGRIVNVLSGRIEEADLAVCGGVIVGLGEYQGREEVDVSGRFLAPGLMDPHLHLESTMLTPAELARVIVPRGTTALLADPHEIANVLGVAGVRYLIEAGAGLPLDIFFMAPSCVPATHLETSGAELTAGDLAPLLEEPRVLGLAEVMNFPGVLAGRRDVWEKLEFYRERIIDGHAPLLGGRDLCAYLLPGIGTEHECTNLGEAEEKLARGLRLFLREGSQARNLAALLPLVTDHNLRRLSFCTDDRHPEDLLRQGHLDHVLRRAVALSLDPVRALTMATLNPAEACRLTRRGALAPGWLADVIVLSDLKSFRVERVYKNGRLVAAEGELLEKPAAAPVSGWASPMNVAGLGRENLRLEAAGPRVRVIELVDAQLLTNHLVTDTPEENGFLAADPGRDLARLFVFERHRGTGNLGQGLVKGFGLSRGALASSIAHDSHNLIAVGVGEEDVLTAVEAVAAMRGGQAVAAGGRVLARRPLPLAGLISLETAEQTAAAGDKLKAAAQELGVRLPDPFMALSFLALPVIPSLRLTDRGLVDVEKFDFTGLFTA
ncbi:MAG: adenine deaminase [Thermodesulfobacteriota bacterium]